MEYAVGYFAAKTQEITKSELMSYIISKYHVLRLKTESDRTCLKEFKGT